MTALAVRARGITKSFGDVVALDCIDFDVAQGQIHGLVGPNGAGKSTTMLALMRLLPSRGLVRFLGADTAGVTTEALVGQGLMLVPETRALFAEMTVEENLLLGAYRRGRPALDTTFAVFPRLLERRRQQAGTLSGGERQMLALGRALMGRPKLLLLDEPSLGLAPRIVRDIFAVLARLRADGLAILLVEQNARAALALSDRALVLEMGEVTLEGPSASLAHDPRVLATYLGERRIASS